MKPIPRKIIIILLVILFAIIAAIALTTPKTQNPTQVDLIDNITVPSLVDGQVPPNALFTREDFKFPSKLPILNIVFQEKNLTKDEASSIAQNMGFSNAPEEISDIADGTVYLWTNANKTLFVRPKTREIKYYDATRPTNSKRLLESEAIKVASDFLTNSKLYPNNEFEFNFIKYFEAEDADHQHITGRESATDYNLNFNPFKIGQKIITPNPLQSPIVVNMLPSGQITGVAIFERWKAINKSSQEYPIKNYDQVISSLNQAKIIALDDGNVTYPDPAVYKITKLTVSKIELAYFMDSLTSSVYQPVFLIEGKAEFTNLKEPISAYLYLPAIAGTP